MLDREIRKKLSEPSSLKIAYRFSTIPKSGHLPVLVPPIWTDGKGSSAYFEDTAVSRTKCVRSEDLDTCFFCLNLNLVDDQQKTIELPDNLYCTSFLELNPSNIQDLLMFQRKYGRIIGARQIPPFTSVTKTLRPAANEQLFAGGWMDFYRDQYDGISASAAIYDSVAHKEYLNEFEVNRLSAVSFREAIATVLDAQEIIRRTTRILRDDLEQYTKQDAILAREATQWLSTRLASSIPIVELATEDSSTHPIELMDAIFMQLARRLVDNSAYRKCANPECGRLFTPEDVGRRKDSRYCSAACQERAKRLRYLAHSKR